MKRNDSSMQIRWSRASVRPAIRCFACSIWIRSPLVGDKRRSIGSAFPFMSVAHEERVYGRGRANGSRASSVSVVSGMDGLGDGGTRWVSCVTARFHC